jgi:hypothetical protein
LLSVYSFFSNVSSHGNVRSDTGIASLFPPDDALFFRHFSRLMSINPHVPSVPIVPYFLALNYIFALSNLPITYINNRHTAAWQCIHGNTVYPAL